MIDPINFYLRPGKIAGNDFTKELVGTTWNLSDHDHARHFNQIYRSSLCTDTNSPDYHRVKISLDTFDDLKNFTSLRPVDHSIDKDTFTRDLDNTAVYIDRGKKKTVIGVGGGSWFMALYKQDGMPHNYAWLLDEKDTDPEKFNVISFREQIERCWKNPSVYDSFFYEGFHDKYPSLPAMAEYITNLFPDNEYYVIGDCKTAHSAALLAYYLNAKRCFLHSAVSSIKEEHLLSKCDTDGNGNFGLSGYMDIPFIVWMRSRHFQHLIPQDKLTVQSIIETMPDCKFRVVYHSDDTEFSWFKDYFGSSDNLEMILVDNKKYTVNNHVLVHYLRKARLVKDFFDHE